MGVTANGLPYPENTDPVTGGDDAIKALAQALDLWLPKLLVPSAAFNITNTIAMADVPGMSAPLGVGTYVCESHWSIGGPAAGDVKIAAVFSGTVTGGITMYDGPSVASTDVSNGPSNSRVVGFATPGAFGTDGSNAGHASMWHKFTVTVAGTLKFQAAQNAANATPTSIASTSWAEVRRGGA
jgi:hypothetical protein